MAKTKIHLGAQGLTGSIDADLFANGSVGASAIGSAVITDVHIGATAAIAYSKLALSGHIVDGDIGATAAIADGKLAESYIKTNGTRGFTADVSHGGNRITNLGQGQTSTDAVTLAQLEAVQSSVNTFEWQPSIQGITGIEQSGSTGDRYLISGGTGAWASYDNYIAEWNGSAWIYTAPIVGMFVANDVQPEEVYLYGGLSWAPKYFEQTVNGDGLVLNGFTMSVNPEIAGNGLTYAGGVINVTGATGILIQADSVSVDVGISGGQIVQLTGSGATGLLPAVDGSAVFNVNAHSVDGVHGASFLRSDANSGLTGATLSIYTGAILNADAGSVVNLAGTIKIAGVTMSATSAELNAVGTIITRETPTPAPDGNAVDFYVLNIPRDGTENLYLNGLLLEPGALADYVVDYPNKKFTFPNDAKPKSTDKIRISYRY